MAMRFIYACFFVTSFALCLSVTYASNPAKITISHDNDIILENGFTKAVFSGVQSSLTSIVADFSGLGNYGSNLLTRPFALEIVIGNATKIVTSKPKYNVIMNSDSVVQVEIAGLSDNEDGGIVQEAWVMTLKRDQRFLDLSIEGRVLQTASVQSIRHSLYTGASSIYGLFDRGIVQMMDNVGSCMGSNQSIGVYNKCLNSFLL